MSRAAALSDFRPRELALSVLASGVVLTGAAIALHATAMDRPALPPAIVEPHATPVRIVPIMDLDAPLLKLGGTRDPSKLPDQFVKPTPKARAEQKAFVSDKAGKTAEDIPPPDVKTAAPADEPPPKDAEIAKQVDTPLAPTVDAGAPANVDEKGHQDGVRGGTETDPLKARAVDLYRAKLAGWFSSRFRVSGSGIPKEDLLKYRVSASVQIGPDRSVVGYSLAPSGQSAFDAAARAALESSRGNTLPPPPESYPDVVQSHISVTFVCRAGRCD